MVRREYKTTIRPFRNSDLQVTITWRRATPGASPLPFPSRICSLDWVGQKALVEGVGEVYGAPRSFIKRGPFGGPVLDHFCGTPEEHSFGELLDITRAPAEYLASGLPACCDPERKDVALVLGMTPVSVRDAVFSKVSVLGLGEGLVSEDGTDFDNTNVIDLGETPVSEQTSRTAHASVIDLGETPVSDHLAVFDHTNVIDLGETPVSDHLAVFDHTNVAGLGETPVSEHLAVFDHTNVIDLGETPVTTHDYIPPPPPPPPTPTPGTNCATAGALPVGTTYSGPLPSIGTPDWFTFVPSVSGTMHIATTGVDGLFVYPTVQQGASCGTASSVFFSTFGPPKWVWTATAGVRVWVYITRPGGPAGTYTLVANYGP